MTRCRSCNKPRPTEDMTAVTGPSGLFHVCRPDVTDLPCFRLAVMGREVHTLVPEDSDYEWGVVPRHPVRPDTTEWIELLRDARA